jgi:ABC-type polysaccharide/polyol phosphate export permease
LLEDRHAQVYDSDRRPPPAIEELRQVFRYRFLIAQILRRDVLTRYKRSVLGIAWTMINPLGTMLVMSVVFSQVFKMEGYSGYILSGLLAWNFFAQTSNAAIINLVWGGTLLKRVYIPRTSFAIAAIGTGLVNLALALIPLVVVLLINKVAITWSVLFLPIPIILIAMFSLGIGLLLSSFAVYYPDVAEMYQIVLIAWMYLTPIIYPAEILPENFQPIIQLLNPMYWLVDLFRAPIYGGHIPSWSDTWPSLVVCTLTLLIGWLVFCRRSDEMAYRV